MKKRFLSKIYQTDDCWEWTGNTDKDGYGKFWINSLRRNDMAHRISYQIFIGEIPQGLWVLHKCDNPSCVNPEHLFVGTAKDNSADRDNKGRGISGERVQTHKLIPSDIPVIKELYQKGFSQREIGEQFNCSQESISRLLLGKSWRCIQV